MLRESLGHSLKKRPISEVALNLASRAERAKSAERLHLTSEPCCPVRFLPFVIAALINHKPVVSRV